MAPGEDGFNSRKDHRKKLELEEARKAGIAPAEVDEDGKEINPHIPSYMSTPPLWSLNPKGPTLKHQRKPNSGRSDKKTGMKERREIYQAEKFRKGACPNCGAMHGLKECVERLRKVGAKWTGKNIAADVKVQEIELDYDRKRDRWNGYDTASYALELERYEAMEEARKKYKKEQQLKKLEEKNNNGNEGTGSSDEEGDLKVDEARVDESKQMDFGKVKKRIRTAGGGSTGTVRNLRIREDTAKYLLNLDVNSAHYDPKTRSMRQDPLPDMDPNEKFYAGDNQNRLTGQAQEFKQLNVYACKSFEKGNDVHMQAAPSQAELLYKNHKINRDTSVSQKKAKVMEKYGNAATGDALPRELLLGQSEKQVEYDRAGRIINGQETYLPRSKYYEDVLINNHIDVWGSWWKDHRWGYKCCHQTIRNSYCTGLAGVEAADASKDHQWG